MAYQPTEKTTRKKAETRQRILNAAHQIVATSGFRALSMQKVAEKAEVASGSLYRYFASKAELCSEVFTVASAKEVDRVRLALQSETHISRQLSGAIDCFARRALKGRVLAWALIAEPIDPVVEQDRLRYRHAYAQVFEQAIKKAISQGQIPRQRTDVYAAAIVGVMSETLVGPLVPNKENLTKKETTQLINTIQRFCLQAVACLI